MKDILRMSRMKDILNYMKKIGFNMFVFYISLYGIFETYTKNSPNLKHI